MKTDYIALLRGINVGGKNIIKMVDLKSSFERMGLENVQTYIQSGNVLFETDTAEDDLEALIETALSKDFDYASTVVVLSAKKLKQIVTHAPANFGSEPETYKYDFIFLKQPLKSKEALKSVKVRDGIDTVEVGPDVLYFSRLTKQLGKSHLSKITKSPIYKQITIRNWNTTTKLLSLFESR